MNKFIFLILIILGIQTLVNRHRINEQSATLMNLVLIVNQMKFEKEKLPPKPDFKYPKTIKFKELKKK